MRNLVLELTDGDPHLVTHQAIWQEAFKEAQRMRQNWLGPEHYLLALLAQPCIASDLMAELGLTYEHLASRLRSIQTVNGRKIRYIESRGVKTNPAARRLDGWAEGFAAGSGRPSPEPEDWLLAIVYMNHGIVGSVMNEIGVSARDVVSAARRRGVRTPEFDPADFRPWRNVREVEVDKSEWQAVVDVLSQKHPPDSQWRWGFNSRRDRPGRVQFVAEEGIELEAIVATVRDGRDLHSSNR